MITLVDIKRLAEIEFADIIKSLYQTEHKLRIILINGSLIDVYLSQKLPGKFGFHWECMDAEATIYRYDNFPDKSWTLVTTFPYHFHNGSQNAVEASPFPLTPLDGFRAFMEFIKMKLTQL